MQLHRTSVFDKLPGKRKKILNHHLFGKLPNSFDFVRKTNNEKKIGTDSVFSLFPPNFSLNLNESHKRRKNIAFCLSKRQMEQFISASVCSFIIHPPAAVIVTAQHVGRGCPKSQMSQINSKQESHLTKSYLRPERNSGK